MKVFLLVPFMCFALMCCNDEPGTSKPKEWDYFVSFVDENGNDFFDGQNGYIRDELRYSVGGELEVGSDVFRPYDSVLVNNIMAYQILPIRSFFYFSFGNGDIDTLTYELDYNNSETDQWMRDLSELRYYYNGDLIATWDFEADPDLKSEIVGRNSLDGREDGLDPIVFYLVKKPDPDEFSE